ncbi:MAG: DUF3857 domain-containing protein [Bacteroidales bacterium]
MVLIKNEHVTASFQKVVRRTELLIQINTKRGEQAAEFELDYSPLDKIDNLSGWIQDTTGRILYKLEKKQITNRSKFSHIDFYSDYKVKCFELKHNQFPYQVHVEYEEVSTEFLHIAWWSPVYNSHAPTRSAMLTVEIPAGYPIHIFQQNLGSPVTDTINRTIRMKWSGQYSRLIKEECCRAATRDLFPYVYIVPGEFAYGIHGSFASWITFGDFIAGLMEGEEDLPASETERVKQMTSGLTDTLAIIKKLFYYLQDNTRYLSVSIDVGGFKPYPASYVSQNKYGDCKALALFMKSLLAVKGIPSFFTLVYGNTIPETIIKNFPAAQFNHAILCVPYKSDTLWLDCTSKDYPVGYTSAFIQGRPALVISKGKSKLVEIPALKPEEVIVNSSYHFNLDGQDKSVITVHSDYRGPHFEDIVLSTVYEDSELLKATAKALLPFQNFELKDYKFTRKTRDDLSVVFDAQITVNGEAKALVDKMIITLPPADIPDFEKVPARVNPVFLPCPSWHHDTIRIVIPAGMKVKSYPAVELSSVAGSYKASSSLDHNNLVYVRDILVQRGEFGLDQYAAIYNWAGAVHAFERQNKIIFIPDHE